MNKFPSLLTCNWYSVQCDEGHPVCRNCVKSKRECLGYDPVFRPQPAPSAIQPAPNPAPSLVVNPQDPPSSYPAAPPGYVPASSQPFAPSVQSDSSTQSHDQVNRTGAEPSVEGSDTMSAMASVQDAVDGSLSQTAGTPSATAPSIARPPSGQFGKQGSLSSRAVVQNILRLTDLQIKSKFRTCSPSKAFLLPLHIPLSPFNKPVWTRSRPSTFTRMRPRSTASWKRVGSGIRVCLSS